VIAHPDGRDFVFVAGAPGSKWSTVAYGLTFCEGVDTTDVDATRRYLAVPSTRHVGSYFGPGMEYGQDFDRLGERDPDSLFAELVRPFRAPGTKILKSHLFSRHLDHLERCFPAARFAVAHRSDDACLEWWLQAGGFDISYPNYAWYREADNMRAQIALDNRAIEDAVASRGIRLSKRRSLSPLLHELGMRLPNAGLTELMTALDDGDGPPASEDDARQRLLACGRVAATAVWRARSR
jgi:hypothetical protein